MEDIIKIIFVILVLSFVGFILRRAWVAIVDSIIGFVKKLFGSKKNDEVKKWHTLNSDVDKKDL